MEQISYSSQNVEDVYLVGIRTMPNSEAPNLYALVLYNEVARNDANRPLTANGRIVLSRSSEAAAESLALGDTAFRKYLPFQGELAYVYDLPKVLDLVANADRDEDGVVADFINEMLDFVAATPCDLPHLHKACLSSLADATTFDKDFGAHLDATARQRSDTYEALIWCVGAIASWSLIT
jgi:hypothetical protein